MRIKDLILLAALLVFVLAWGLLIRVSIAGATETVNDIIPITSRFKIYTDTDTCVQYLYTTSSAGGLFTLPRLDRFGKVVLAVGCNPRL